MEGAAPVAPYAAGEHQIAEHQVDLVGSFFVSVQRLSCVGGLENAVVEDLQHIAQGLARRFVVFHDQNGFLRPLAGGLSLQEVQPLLHDDGFDLLQRACLS